MTIRVNLNADMGEGWGAYDIGNDEGLLRHVRSASIACGFHGGDFTTMARTVWAAREHGVSIGAHPGFNDLWGFGRRRIEMTPREIEYMVAYQIGALQALANFSDMSVTHVKAHGALSNMATENRDYALAIARAVKTVDHSLIYVAISGTLMDETAEEIGLTIAREAFCDRLYEDDGTLTSRKIAGSVITDPELARSRTVEMVRDAVVIARSGKRLPRRIDTLCIHGDEPTSIDVAKAVRHGLGEAGIQVVPLTEMPLGG